MMRWMLLVWIVLLMPADAAAHGPTASDPPNIIVVFIDDMGYGDLGVTGNRRSETPNIDRLAREGTRFTQFYVNSPICSPSRVALTTGHYPSRWEIDSFLASRKRNRERGLANFLSLDAPTLPRALQQAGYATAHYGKWHMGGGRDVGEAPLITEYGFDESLTSFEGLGDRYLWEDGLNRRSAELGRGEITWTEKYEMTRVYVDHAIDFIRRHQDEPFYVNVWPNDVHDRHVPRPELMEKYAGIARNEYEQRFFAVLDDMDRQLGRLFDEVDRLGLAENTLIVFTSDNGPTDWPKYYNEGVEPPGSTGPFFGRKWSLYEGGIRMPLIARWSGTVPAGRVDTTTVMAAMDLVPSLASLAGAEYPAVDGVEMSDALLGEPQKRLDPIFWYYPNDLEPGNPDYISPKLAVRDGKWKLLVEEDGTGAELYDLENDPGEATNLLYRHPEIAALLKEKVLSWHEQVVAPPPGTDERPNIILIVADDLGWNDVGYHGSEIRTPNIDRLADEGVRLERFYVAPICSPTRAGLLTGRSPIRYGRMAAVMTPWGSAGLPVDETLLPELLAELGYRWRAAIGKWHLGQSDPAYHPLRRGFTHFYGHYTGAIDYFTHERAGELDWHEDWETSRDEGYATDLLTDRAVRFIDEYADAEPFFLYLAYNAPHTPLQAPDSAIATYPNLEGNRQVYAAMVSQMDAGIGEVREALERNGLSDSTVIWFMSDNGGNRNGGASNEPLRGQKQHTFEGGIRVPSVVWWKNRLSAAQLEESIKYTDVFPTILEIADAGPRIRAEKPLDGVDVSGVLQGDEALPQRDIPMFWAQNGEEERLALIRGRWKLVYYGPSMPAAVLDDDAGELISEGDVYLFDLKADPTERHDLSAEHPERTAEMFNALKAFRDLRPADAVPPYTVGREGFVPPKEWRMD